MSLAKLFRTSALALALIASISIVGPTSAYAGGVSGTMKGFKVCGFVCGIIGGMLSSEDAV